MRIIRGLIAFNICYMDIYTCNILWHECTVGYKTETYAFFCISNACRSLSLFFSAFVYLLVFVYVYPLVIVYYGPTMPMIPKPFVWYKHVCVLYIRFIVSWIYTYIIYICALKPNQGVCILVYSFNIIIRLIWKECKRLNVSVVGWSSSETVA